MKVEISLHAVLALSAALFTIGVAGVLVRRNLLVVFMSVELMLNGVNVAFVGFARQWADVGGHLAALLTMAVAASEVAVGLALVILLFRNRGSSDLDDLTLLRG